MSGYGVMGFSTGQHDVFFMVLEELATTLKQKMATNGDWNQEDMFLQDRLGHDYAYGYYYHHHHHPPINENNYTRNRSSVLALC